ncbi:hypothetical protein DFJ74DRAFT_664332 [Hyaloraphidium curvatum]|nr:hypothetical protein DFJ74DRAFT_664332 [Hyaloraphidium curvatum]
MLGASCCTSSYLPAAADRYRPRIQFVHYMRNIIHLRARRFYPFANQIIGLSAEQAVLQCRWAQNLSARVAEQTLLGAMIKAKAAGLDLERCYVTDVDVLPRAITHPSLKLRGQGPYGATPHPATALFHLVLTERPDLPAGQTSIRRDVPPEIEELRSRLRAWMRDRDAHTRWGVPYVRDEKGRLVGYGRRKREGVKEMGGFGIVGAERRRKKVVYA